MFWKYCELENEKNKFFWLENGYFRNFEDRFLFLQRFLRNREDIKKKLWNGIEWLKLCFCGFIVNLLKWSSRAQVLFYSANGHKLFLLFCRWFVKETRKVICFRPEKPWILIIHSCMDSYFNILWGTLEKNFNFNLVYTSFQGILS